jgi:hypothetical protein
MFYMFRLLYAGASVLPLAQVSRLCRLCYSPPGGLAKLIIEITKYVINSNYYQMNTNPSVGKLQQKQFLLSS